MEKVVYILGAGFSAPLGLPVMSNFLEKSHDKFDQSDPQYAYFNNVLKAIREMQVVNQYYQTDLSNIEDILSILEFKASLSNDKIVKVERKQFLKYIQDVIESFTPPFPNNLDLSNVTDRSIPIRDIWSPYLNFVASIFGYTFIPLNGSTPKNFRATDDDYRSVEYSIISLNYDLVLEECEKYLNGFGVTKHFCKQIDQKNANDIYLAKLHGSIDLGNIVPPTWNKGITDTNLYSWQIAYKVLSQANHIRILGYSLPSTDSYIKYLLRTAITEQTLPNLKHIDVLCFDADGSTRNRYSEFVKFHKGYRFKSALIETYLSQIGVSQVNNEFRFSQLELNHSGFFGGP